MSKEKQIDEAVEFLNNRINVERNSYFGKGCITIPLIEADKILDIIKGYRKQSEGELTRAHIQAHYEAIYALADMVLQFGYSTTFRKQDAVCDGGLSALEYAFGALLDCGCKTNSNGTITLKNLWAFQEEMRVKMEGGE